MHRGSARLRINEALTMYVKVSKRYIFPIAIFIGSLVFYWITAARSPGWIDATLILNSVKNLNIGIWAINHNLFNLLGNIWLRILPGLDPHFALVMLCALLGTVTVLFIYFTGVEITGNHVAASLTALAMMLSLSLW